MANFCEECGFKLESFWKNCPKCGASLNSAPIQTLPSTPIIQSLTPEKIDQLLVNNYTFSFKAKFTYWYFFYIILALIFGGVITFVLTAFVNPFMFVLGILIIIIAETIIGLWIRYEMSFMLEVSPKAITLWKNKNINFQSNFLDIYNIEFLIQTTTVDNVSSRENKFKIITKAGLTKKITADYWDIHSPLPTDAVIKQILSYYYRRSRTNP